MKVLLVILMSVAFFACDRFVVSSGDQKQNDTLVSYFSQLHVEAVESGLLHPGDTALRNQFVELYVNNPDSAMLFCLELVERIKQHRATAVPEQQ